MWNVASSVERVSTVRTVTSSVERVTVASSVERVSTVRTFP